MNTDRRLKVATELLDEGVSRTQVAKKLIAEGYPPEKAASWVDATDKARREELRVQALFPLLLGLALIALSAYWAYNAYNDPEDSGRLLRFLPAVVGLIFLGAAWSRLRHSFAKEGDDSWRREARRDIGE